MIFHDVQQNSDAWHELRLGKATASNFAVIMASSPNAFGDPAKRYALQIALEQITGRKATYGFSNDHMERGGEQEPLARMIYEDLFFADVTNGGFFDCGHYGDSPDGLVGDDGVIEIKSVIASTHWATRRRGTYDPSYRWQMIGHLDCTGRDWCDFISFCSDFPDDDQLAVYRMNRAEVADDIELLRERRARFFSELVTPCYEQISRKIT